jgi:hypothetical protein
MRVSSCLFSLADPESHRSSDEGGEKKRILLEWSEDVLGILVFFPVAQELGAKAMEADGASKVG